MASKSTRNDFVFTTNGYLKMDKNQATCTFLLESNSKRSLLEIVQRGGIIEDCRLTYLQIIDESELENSNVIDPERSWSSYDVRIDHGKKGGAILHKFRRNSDSGISAGSSANSKTCTIMWSLIFCLSAYPFSEINCIWIWAWIWNFWGFYAF